MPDAFHRCPGSGPHFLIFRRKRRGETVRRVKLAKSLFLRSRPWLMSPRLAPAQPAIETAGKTSQWISEEENHPLALGNVPQRCLVTMPFDDTAGGLAAGLQGMVYSRAARFSDV